jgi:hypothetical protein
VSRDLLRRRARAALTARRQQCQFPGGDERIPCLDRLASLTKSRGASPTNPSPTRNHPAGTRWRQPPADLGAPLGAAVGADLGANLRAGPPFAAKPLQTALRRTATTGRCHLNQPHAEQATRRRPSRGGSRAAQPTALSPGLVPARRGDSVPGRGRARAIRAHMSESGRERTRAAAVPGGLDRLPQVRACACYALVPPLPASCRPPLLPTRQVRWSSS